MIIINKRILIFFGSFFVLSACKKDAATISTTPEIEFVTIAPTQAKQGVDQITVTLAYKDGDGDLGENDANAKNLFLTDSRNGVTYQFRLQQLAPDGASIAIKGNLNVELDNALITDGSSSQKVTYSLYVIDRSGHKSNTIITSEITITN